MYVVVVVIYVCSFSNYEIEMVGEIHIFSVIHCVCTSYIIYTTIIRLHLLVKGKNYVRNER